MDRPQVTVRALASAHVPAVLDACADWEELARFGPPYWRPRSEAELHRKIAATAGPVPATEYTFVLEIQDGRLVGECSVHAIDWRNRLAQIGICIWQPDDRRSGYGRVGVQFASAWAFDHLGLHRLEAWIVDGNDGSHALFTQLDWTHEATLRSRYLYAGVHRDTHVLSQSASLGVDGPEIVI